MTIKLTSDNKSSFSTLSLHYVHKFSFYTTETVAIIMNKTCECCTKSSR